MRLMTTRRKNKNNIAGKAGKERDLLPVEELDEVLQCEGRGVSD